MYADVAASQNILILTPLSRELAALAIQGCSLGKSLAAGSDHKGISSS